MKKFDFWSGLILGSILGISFTLLSSRAGERMSKMKREEEGNDVEKEQCLGEQVADKLNIGNKINQLEESIKNLRKNSFQ